MEQEIVTNGSTAVYIPCDISQEGEVVVLIEKTVALFGGIDILFNNAGIMLPSMEIERMPVEDLAGNF